MKSINLFVHKNKIDSNHYEKFENIMLQVDNNMIIGPSF